MDVDRLVERLRPGLEARVEMLGGLDGYSEVKNVFYSTER